MIVCGLIGLFGVCLAVAAVFIVVTELWGIPLFDRVGLARPTPVWLAWVGMAIGLAGGLQLAATNLRYVYRVARRQIPRDQRPTDRRRPKPNDRETERPRDVEHP